MTGENVWHVRRRSGVVVAMTTRILVLGSGHLGLVVAQRLQRKLRSELRRGEVELTIVSPDGLMTYQPFLPEAAAGNMEPRHVVVPLRKVLNRCQLIVGRVTRIDADDRSVTMAPLQGPPRRLTYDHLVVGLGAVPRVLPIPGLSERGIGFSTIGEAIHLRNQVLSRLEVANATQDEAVRRRALTVLVVGGGYAGTEAVAEMHDMARSVARVHMAVDPAELRFLLVEATGRILPEVGEELGRYTVDRLRERGVEVLLDTRMESCVEGRVVLSNGESFESDTIVWTAGVRANPVLAHSDLPLDERGRVVSSATLLVRQGVWAAGDNAAVPDLTRPGQLCSPSAQHAVRQGARLAANLVAVLRHQEPKEYRHAYAGSVASLGLYRGAAQIYGIKLKGLPAWLMHRTYHLSRLPTLDRKVRVALDWALALFFQREVVALGQIEDPRASFVRASSSDTEKPPATRAS
jgi:NADH dehydrogenase